MLHYLIKVTDNSLVVVIVLALILGLLRLGDWKKSRAIFCSGLVLGILAALVYAILKRNTGFAVREFYDLGVNIPAVVLAFFMIPVALLGLGRPVKPNFLSLCVTALFSGLLAAYILPNLLLYPFEFGVGMDSIYNTDYLAKIAGYALGCLLLFLLGLAIYKTVLKSSRSLVLTLFVVVLLLFIAKLGLEIAQVVVARRLILNTRALMPFVMFALTHVNWLAFSFLAVLGFFTATHFFRQKTTPMPVGNPAQIRKEKAQRRSQFRYCASTFCNVILFLFIITWVRDYDGREVEISEPIEIEQVNGQIILPLENINDGHLHRFSYTCKDGTHMRYIVIRKTETAYGVGLDACDICGPSGYYERKDQVICKLCDVVMNKSTIGFPGGCNPVPLAFSISPGKMIIETEDLENLSNHFK